MSGKGASLPSEQINNLPFGRFHKFHVKIYKFFFLILNIMGPITFNFYKCHSWNLLDLSLVGTPIKTLSNTTLLIEIIKI